MKDFNGRVAAITGAGSGIGRALAMELAACGCNLALSDVDAEGLAESARRCGHSGVTVTTKVVDVADEAAMFAWADAVADEHGKVNLVFNNAGVALGFDVETMSMADFHWLMGINFWGVVHGTKAFLPHLTAAGEGHIVNISSVFGLIGIPTQSAYNAAKFAVRGFTDSLRLELKIERSPVSCTTVHPGGVKTNIVRSARVDPEVLDRGQVDDPGEAFEAVAPTTPEQAAHVILKAVRRDRRRVVIGWDGYAFDLVSRLPAAVYHLPIILGGRRAERQAQKRRPVTSGAV